MLKVDRLTSIHSRGQYARICVEVDLDRPLKSFIEIRGHKLFLEYEGLHLICFHCGKYGHKANQSEDNLSLSEDKSNHPSTDQEQTSSGGVLELHSKGCSKKLRTE